MESAKRQAWPQAWRRAGTAAFLALSGTAWSAPALPDTPASATGLALLESPLDLATATATATAAEPAPPARHPLALQLSLAALRARLQPSPHAESQEESVGMRLQHGMDIQVVELPHEGATIGPPPKRAHHALSIGMDGPKRMLRGLGLDATECAARFRLPSRLKRQTDGSTQVDIAAQLGMACKF